MGNMRRRNFLKVTFGALTVGPVVARAAAFGAYDRVRLGRSGIETSRLCFGTGYKAFNRVSEQTRLGHDAFVALLRAGYERGIRCFDAADLYGSHRPLAEALKPFPRDRYTLISKIWWRKGGVPEEDKTAVPEQIRRFLKELKTDHVDIVQLHCLTDGGWQTELADRMEALEACKKAGMIRAHGVSVHGFKALQACATSPWVDVAHVRLNPYGVKMEGTVEANLPVIRAMRGKGQGIIAMKLLGEGAFSHDGEKINASLAFALRSGLADVLNIGFMSTAQIDDIAARIAAVTPNAGGTRNPHPDPLPGAGEQTTSP
jgi:aryl-alcohol dehydrogenase-like predicted oxidoreductase